MRRILCLFFLLGALLAAPMSVDAGRHRRQCSGSSCTSCSPAVTKAMVDEIDLEFPSFRTIPDQVEMLRLHNEARAARGLAPLKNDADLVIAAQRSANAQRQRNQCGHFTPLSIGGENCAMGHSDEADVTNAWMQSPGHRSNILGSWSRVGFGRDGNAWAARFAP